MSKKQTETSLVVSNKNDKKSAGADAAAIIKVIKKYGPTFIKMAREHGPEISRAVKKYGPTIAKNASKLKKKK